MTYEECTAARRRARMKALHADPEFAARHREAASNRMKALHADPEFAARNREASSARMKALNADPEFAERRSNRMKALHADPARNPLVLLTPQERTDYNTLKKVGHPRADALRAIGRADLVAK